MDEYKDVEHGYVFDVQSDLPWTQTNRMTLRAPAIANRIFDTLAHAQAYIDDISPKASAVGGLVLSITKEQDPKKNGLYRVVSYKVGNTPGVLERVGFNVIHDVNNLTTDLASFTEQGVYFIRNISATPKKTYTLYVTIDNNTVIQELVGADGYQSRVLTGEWTVKNYSLDGHTHVLADVKIKAGSTKTLGDALGTFDNSDTPELLTDAKTIIGGINEAYEIGCAAL